jgi:hypothetical protein
MRVYHRISHSLSDEYSTITYVHLKFIKLNLDFAVITITNCGFNRLITFCYRTFKVVSHKKYRKIK